MLLSEGMDIYQLSLSMVTALLGLSYPLLIDKVNAISDKYESRWLSEMFQDETVYRLFHTLLCFCIIETFLIPYLVLQMGERVSPLIFLTIQAVTVFALTASMVVLYALIMTYYDARKLLRHIKQLRYSSRKLKCLQDLMVYASQNERDEDVFNECISEIWGIMLEYQKK